MSLVFLSYAEEDADFAHRIFDILDSLYLYPYAYSLLPDYGGVVEENIKLEISNCDIVLCLLTENGIRSPWVNQEIGMAFMAGKRIIPVIEEGFKREGIIEFRSSINYNPNDLDETIYSILYALRLKYNPQKIRLYCESCDEYFDGLLPGIEALNKVIERRGKGENIVWQWGCPNKNHVIQIDPKTLEAIK